MPELPEVETVCRGLRTALRGKKLVTLETRRKDLRTPFPRDIATACRGAVVEDVVRRAKYILMRFDNGRTLILHLGMSGRMLVEAEKDAAAPQKHDHILFHFSGGTRVTFRDPRRFGLADTCQTADIPAHRFFAHLGPEPFDRTFGAAYLEKTLKGRKTAIKIAIMDQRIVVGVGNIYAAEALFIAGIHPARAAGSLKTAEIRKLAAAIRAVLKRAIAAGGSSLRDYVQTDGNLGYFQHRWAVYDKQGQACKGCACRLQKTGGIAKITQGGRSTFFCPQKQKKGS